MLQRTSSAVEIDSLLNLNLAHSGLGLSMTEPEGASQMSSANLAVCQLADALSPVLGPFLEELLVILGEALDFDLSPNLSLIAPNVALFSPNKVETVYWLGASSLVAATCRRSIAQRPAACTNLRAFAASLYP